MRVLIIRHALAQKRAVFHAEPGRDDSERPLTSKGEARMRRAAPALRRYAEQVKVLATSPYRRAAQTARILADRSRFPEPVEIEVLKPDQKPQAVLDWLARQGLPGSVDAREAEPSAAAVSDLAVAIVGHEPDLSRLVAFCVTGRQSALGELKKGAVCSLQFPGDIAPGKARIEWLLDPKQLRRLGRH